MRKIQTADFAIAILSVRSSNGLLLQPWRLQTGTCTRKRGQMCGSPLMGHVCKCQITHDKALGVVSETWTYQKPEDHMPDDENKGTGAARQSHAKEINIKKEHGDQ